MGGTDHSDNLIRLTVKEHAEAHFNLYKKFGIIEDLCAYYMLSGKNQDPEFVSLRGRIGGRASYQRRLDLGLTGRGLFYGKEVPEEQILKWCSQGGKIQGPINKDSGHMRRIQKMADLKKAGQKGGSRKIELKKGAFGDPQLRLKRTSLGGKVQGRINVENGHLLKISKDPVLNKQRAEKMKGKKWYNNGSVNILTKDETLIKDLFHGKI